MHLFYKIKMYALKIEPFCPITSLIVRKIYLRLLIHIKHKNIYRYNTLKQYITDCNVAKGREVLKFKSCV